MNKVASFALREALDFLHPRGAISSHDNIRAVVDNARRAPWAGDQVVREVIERYFRKIGRNIVPGEVELDRLIDAALLGVA